MIVIASIVMNSVGHTMVALCNVRAEQKKLAVPQLTGYVANLYGEGCVS
jgi:hypothetical protein